MGANAARFLRRLEAEHDQAADDFIAAQRRARAVATAINAAANVGAALDRLDPLLRAPGASFTLSRARLMVADHASRAAWKRLVRADDLLGRAATFREAA